MNGVKLTAGGSAILNEQKHRSLIKD